MRTYFSGMLGGLMLWSTAVFAGELSVSQADYGDKWAFTVPHGTLVCRNTYLAIFRDGKGNEYQLNGAASSAGYPQINPIWRDNPSFAGIKVDIGPFIERALGLC